MTADDLETFFKYLNDGYSTSYSLSKSRISTKQYKELRKRFPDLKEAVRKYYKGTSYMCKRTYWGEKK